MADAGKVSLRPRGRFDITVTYERLDFVKYNTGCYVALQTTTGNLPTDTTNFMNLIDFDIANMSQIGLVKPDGESTTIDADGTLHAHTIGSVTSFNGRTGEVLPQTSDYTAAQVAYDNTDSSLTATNVKSAIDQLSAAADNDVLFLENVTCNATTGDFVHRTDPAITAKHVVVECVFANPAAITTDVTWTTANGSLRLNGTCTSATTATITLVKKDN